MYILLNKTLITIPYKHRDPFVLCDVVVIEFPADYVEIFPVDNNKPFNELVNSDLKALYAGLYGEEKELDRFQLIDAIMKFISEAEESDIGKYHAQYQAKAFEIDRQTRHNFIVGSYTPARAAAAQPNTSFIKRNDAQCAISRKNTTANTNAQATANTSLVQYKPPWEV
jgi:hypothetical protein